MRPPKSAGGALLVTAALTLYWLARPVTGIRHDALYYMADALRRLPGGSLSADPFFHRQSQGDFSIFGPLAAVLAGTLGIDGAASLLALLGCLAWLLALGLLSRRLLGDGVRGALGFALVLCLPRFYDGNMIFSIAEPFATPRPWAEAAAMLSLALAVPALHGAGRLQCLVPAGLSLALHPLMALPALAWHAFWHPGTRRRAAWLLGGCAAALAGLGAAGISPLDRLWQRFDAGWWAVVDVANQNVLLQHWTADALARVAVQGLVLAVVGWQMKRRHDLAGQRAASALLLAWAILTSLWAIGCASRNVLLVQLQLWRVNWLVMVVLPLLWLRTHPIGVPWTRLDQTRLALLGAAWLGGMHGVLAALLWAGSQRPAVERRLAQARWFRWLLWATAAATLPVLALLAQDVLLQAQFHAGTDDWRWLVGDIAALPLPALLVLACVAWLARRGATLRHLADAALCIAAAAMLVSWVYSARWQPAPDERALVRAVAAHLPADALVWAERGNAWTWLDLHHAHYSSRSQAAGALFSRDTSLRLLARNRTLASLGLLDDSDDMQRQGGNNRALRARGAMLASALDQLCVSTEVDTAIVEGHLANADWVVAISPSATVSGIDCWRRRNAP